MPIPHGRRRPDAPPNERPAPSATPADRAGQLVCLLLHCLWAASNFNSSPPALPQPRWPPQAHSQTNDRQNKRQTSQPVHERFITPPPKKKRGGLVGRSYQGVGVPHGVWGPDQPNHLVSAVHAQDTQEKKEKRKEKMAKPDSRAINRGSARHQQQRRRRRRGALSCLTRALSLGRGRPRRCAHVRVQRGGRCRLPLCRYLPHTGLV